MMKTVFKKSEPKLQMKLIEKSKIAAAEAVKILIKMLGFSY